MKRDERRLWDVCALRSLVISGMTYETLRSIWEQHLLLSLYFVFVFSLKHVHMVQMTDTTLLNGHQPKHMISNNSALKRRTTILVVSHPRCFLFLLLYFLSSCYYKVNDGCHDIRFSLQDYRDQNNSGWRYNHDIFRKLTDSRKKNRI